MAKFNFSGVGSRERESAPASELMAEPQEVKAERLSERMNIVLRPTTKRNLNIYCMSEDFSPSALIDRLVSEELEKHTREIETNRPLYDSIEAVEQEKKRKKNNK